MRVSEPSQANMLRAYRPQCSKCGTLEDLSRIEPADEPGHDLRTFGCRTCGNTDVVMIRFK